MTKREKEILDETISIIKRYLKPKRIYLFGSRAKNTASRTSDFDFAVEMDIQEKKARDHVKDLVEAVSGLYKVDIVFFDEIEKDFQNIIFKTGKIVYGR